MYIYIYIILYHRPPQAFGGLGGRRGKFEKKCRLQKNNREIHIRFCI